MGLLLGLLILFMIVLALLLGLSIGLACLNNAVCGLAARGGQSNLAALQRSLADAIDRLLFRR